MCWEQNIKSVCQVWARDIQDLRKLRVLFDFPYLSGILSGILAIMGRVK
jgi:hypothetical protein